MIDTTLRERFTSRGRVIDLRGLAPFFRTSEGERARFNKGEVWGELGGFLMAGVNSLTLCDFLCRRSCESTNML